ncbi:cytochrome C oxidase subunit IV family protein [Myxococcota bacterium]|nr:cytochrome C oxidase subunit IV family protein [Myxococcota bacterium]MCZ7617878.1 cytochrome C oxidase subunit IV family protein [Myxococcota bacterium]
MTSQQAHDSHLETAAAEPHVHHGNYVRIWVILVVLLVASVLGPMLGHPIVTLVTAFGIAIVKAYLVAKNFMHINVAPRFVGYLVATCLLFMLLFFAGTAPDVMRLEGTRWEKPGWIEANRSHEAGSRAATGH